MKASKRNIHNSIAAHEKRKDGKPKLSKYERKTRPQADEEKGQ